MKDSALVDVSESLRAVLFVGLTAEPALVTDSSAITFASPADLPAGRPSRLSLYLYRVTEHALSRARRTDVGSPLHEEGSPLELVLYYLLTPYAATPEEEMRLLARVLQTLYDHAVLSGADLRGELAGSSALQVRIRAPEMEEWIALWSALRTPMRLAISCEVRVARIGGVPEHRR
ncbi:MAG: DUF4255 domain-containing protein [Chloroflexi bacterium]|nr:DUF4255 domain-containing protein [Chloroflexota bacterium]